MLVCSAEPDQVEDVDESPINLRLVALQHHVLGFHLLVAFDLHYGATGDEKLVLVRIWTVFLVVQAEAWVVDLVEHVQNEDHWLLL